MKIFFVLYFTWVCLWKVLPQEQALSRLIFIPHPRSESTQKQTVLPGIEKINFSLYDMILLGGDLTYYSSKNTASMDYLDSLFNLNNPNTLWTMGNHDLSNPELVMEYTGRELSYTYYRDNITFLVINTEQNSNGFQSTYILGEQLEMLRNVCDTISYSDFLIVMHGRLMWMIGNDDFKTRLDSVAESTKQLDTTNFYQDLYPEFLKVKGKGIPVICLGGDKSKINIEYSPEDSITFLASTMAPEYTDNINDVIILEYNNETDSLVWKFVPLDKVEKNPDYPIIVKNNIIMDEIFQIRPIQATDEVVISISEGITGYARISIYTIQGLKTDEFILKAGENRTYYPKTPGVYIIAGINDNNKIIKKFIVCKP